jgi:hypothetical protein
LGKTTLRKPFSELILKHLRENSRRTKANILWCLPL